MSEVDRYMRQAFQQEAITAAAINVGLLRKGSVQ